MKKFAITLSLITLLGLMGCQNQSPNESESIYDSDTGESDIIIPETYESSSWDETVKLMIDETTIDGSNFIPVCSGNNYYTYFEDVTSPDGETSVTCTIINVYGINPQKIIDDYEDLLVNNSFGLSGDYNAAFHLASATEDTIVQYELSSDDTYLELLIYRTATRLKDFPNTSIESIIGEKIPYLDAESYSIDYSYEMHPTTDTTNYHYGEMYTKAIMYAHNLSAKQMSDYRKTLTSNGYKLENSSSSIYNYISKDEYIHLTLYETADEYNRPSLYIACYSKWSPAIDYSYSALGIILPTIGDKYSEDISYGVNNDSFVIYDDYTSEEEYDSYRQKLEDDGWVEEKYTKGKISHTYFYSHEVEYEGETYTAKIGVSYGFAQYINDYSMIIYFSI